MSTSGYSGNMRRAGFDYASISAWREGPRIAQNRPEDVRGNRCPILVPNPILSRSRTASAPSAAPTSQTGVGLKPPPVPLVSIRPACVLSRPLRLAVPTWTHSTPKPAQCSRQRWPPVFSPRCWTSGVLSDSGAYHGPNARIYSRVSRSTSTARAKGLSSKNLISIQHPPPKTATIRRGYPDRPPDSTNNSSASRFFRSSSSK